MKIQRTLLVLNLLLLLPITVHAQEEPDEFDFLLPTMTVVVDALRIRDLPTTEGSEIIGMLHRGDVVPYAEMVNKWARIKAPDGTVGWSCVELGGETFMAENIYVLFRGTLTDAGGAPVEGAVVDLVGTGKSYVTNGEGWFSDMLVPKGTWDLRVTVGDRSALLEDAAPTEAECSEETYAFNLYTDYRLTITIEEADGIAKPNIYIYPTEVTEVSVKLGFPAGGLVTVSDPPYGDGWRVTVTPEGTINGEHTFLFYEGRSGGVPLQRSQGWIVKREELEGFFRKNLTVTGFYEQEIEDFVEFWVPHLTDHPYFALHPQYNAIYGEIVSLDVEPEPHSLIRLAYVIEGLEEEMELMPAEIPAFEAGGFTVHEWGVILSPADVSAYLY